MSQNRVLDALGPHTNTIQKEGLEADIHCQDVICQLNTWVLKITYQQISVLGIQNKTYNPFQEKTAGHHTHTQSLFFSFHHRPVKTAFLASTSPLTGDWDPLAPKPVIKFSKLSWITHCEPASVLVWRLFPRVCGQQYE